MNADDLDKRVRAEVYDRTMRRGVPPRSAEVAEALSVTHDSVRESFARLAAGRVLVLQPDSEILMIPPFSAVPTPFHVQAGSFSTYANCIWDALGVAAMLHADAAIHTSCGDCGQAMRVDVKDGQVFGEGLLHFAIPAREWWKDIVFT